MGALRKIGRAVGLDRDGLDELAAIDELTKGKMRECPECGKKIFATAAKCPHCGKRSDPVEKAAVTFAELMAQRELDDRLPLAFDTLRSSIFRAFFPVSDDDFGGRSPSDVIAESLDEFKDWALALVGQADGDLAKRAADHGLALDEIRKAQTGESGNVGSVEEREFTEAVEDLQDSIDELPDKIAKAIRDGGEDEDGNGSDNGDGSDEGNGDEGDEDKAARKPTLAGLAKSQAALTKQVGEIAANVKALGSGGTSQPADSNSNGTGDAERVDKSADPSRGIL